MSLSGESEQVPNQPVTEVPQANTPVKNKEAKPHLSLNLADIRDYVIAIACFGISLAAVFLLIIPQFGRISELGSKITSSQNKLSEVTRQSDYLQGLVGLQDELESKIEIADQVLPSTEDRVPYTLDQLVQIAEESGVVVDSLSLSGISEPDTADVDGVRTVLMQLTIVGSLSNVQDFIFNLEQARTVVDVATFQIAHESVTVENTLAEGDEATSVIEQVKANFALRSYLKPEVTQQVVDLSALANSPNYDGLFEKLNEMDFYDTEPLEIEFGRDNPFEIEEATPSIEEDLIIEELPVSPEDEDISGFE